MRPGCCYSTWPHSPINGDVVLEIESQENTLEYMDRDQPASQPFEAQCGRIDPVVTLRDLLRCFPSREIIGNLPQVATMDQISLESPQ